MKRIGKSVYFVISQQIFYQPVFKVNFERRNFVILILCNLRVSDITNQVIKGICETLLRCAFRKPDIEFTFFKYISLLKLLLKELYAINQNVIYPKYQRRRL